MAIYTININSTDYSVFKNPILSTDCATTYSYKIQATNGDSIQITLTPNGTSDNPVNSYCISNGVNISFTLSTTITFNTSLEIHFSIPNSGRSGYFNSLGLSIVNATTSGSYDTYMETLLRPNDSIKCEHVGGIELNDLTQAVVWDVVPNGFISQSSVTQHQSALTITESQISDLLDGLNSTDFVRSNHNVKMPIKVTSTNPYTVVNGDYQLILHLDGMTLNLPDPSLHTGRILKFSGEKFIWGTNPPVMPTAYTGSNHPTSGTGQYGSASVHSDGVKWWVVGWDLE